MANVKIVLDVDGTQAASEVKKFSTDLDAQFKRVRDSGAAMATGVAASSEKLSQMMQRAGQDVRPVEEAFKTLGLRSSASIDQARDRLTQAFEQIKSSGTASTADLTRAQDAYNAKLKKLSDEQVPEAQASMQTMGDRFKHVAEIMLGVSFANFLTEGITKIAEFGRELFRMGVEAQQQEQSFHLVAAAVGANADALATGLQRASKGMANVSDIMLASARALQQGLNPDDLIRVMEIARAQSQLAGSTVTQAFNDITVAITNQMARGLKNYGIIIDSTKAYEDYAAKLKVNKEALTETGQSQAFMAAVLETMKGRTDALANATETMAQRQQRMTAAYKDFLEGVGVRLVTLWVAMIDKLTLATVEVLDFAAALGTVTNKGIAAIPGLGTVAKWIGFVADAAARGTTATDAHTKAQSANAEAAAKAVAGQKILQPAVDATKNTVVQSEKELKRLTDQYTIGTVGAQAFAAGVRAQITALQAVAQPTEESRARLLALQAQLATFDYQQFQKQLEQRRALEDQALQRRVDAVRVAVAERVMAEGEGLLREDTFRIADLQRQRATYAEILATHQLNADQRADITKQYIAADKALETARATARIDIGKRETDELRAQSDLEASQRATASKLTLAAIQADETQRLAVLQATAGSELTLVGQVEAVRVASAQQQFNSATFWLERSRLAVEADLAAGLLAERDYTKKLDELDKQRADLLIMRDKAILGARLDSLKAYTQQADAQRNAEQRADDDYYKKISALLDTTSRAKSLAADDERRYLVAAIALTDDVTQKEELRAQLNRVNSEARIRQFRVVADTNAATNQRELDEELRSLTERTTAEQRAAVARTVIQAQQRQEAGDYFGFLTAQFKLAAVNGGNLWDSIAQGATNAFGGMTNWVASTFDGFVKGTVDAKAAMLSFADVFLQEIERIAAQKLVAYLFGKVGGFVTDLVGQTASHATTQIIPDILRSAQGGIAGVGSLGGGPTDMIHALLSPGELIVNPSATQKLLHGDLSGLFEQLGSLKDKFFGTASTVGDVLSGKFSVADLTAKATDWVSKNPGLTASSAAALLALALQMSGNEDAAKAGAIIGALAPVAGVATTLAIGGISGATGVALGASAAATSGAAAGSFAAGTAAAAGTIGAAAAAGAAVAFAMAPLIIGPLISGAKPETPLTPAERGGMGYAALFTPRPWASLSPDEVAFAMQSERNYDLVQTRFALNPDDPSKYVADNFAPGGLLTASGDTVFDLFHQQAAMGGGNFAPGAGTIFAPPSAETGGLVRVHNREAIVPAPFTEELPVFAEEVRAMRLAHADASGGGGELRAEVAGLRADMRAFAQRPVVLQAKVNGRVFLELLRTQLKDAASAGDKVIPSTVIHPVTNA